MRQLNSNLEAVQKSASGVPAVQLLTAGLDRSSRVRSIVHRERTWGGTATIILDNSDLALNADDMRGVQVDISYGYQTLQGKVYSRSPRLWVYSNQELSQEGQLLWKLECIDIWHKLSLERVVGGGQDLTGTVVGVFQPGMWVTGRTTGVKARVLHAGETYIAVANRLRSTSFADFAVGEKVTSDLDSNISVTITSVGNWSGGPGPGWAGSHTILGMIQQITAGIVTVTLDSSDGIVNVQKPYLFVETNASVLNIIKDLMGRTKCGIRASDDGNLHIFTVASDPTPQYTYKSSVGTGHVHIDNVRDRKLVLPNRIIVYNSKQTVSGTVAYSGSADDVGSQLIYGRAITEILDLDVQSDAEAASIDGAVLRRVQMEAVAGSVTANMNCGQELLDYIRVEDTRNSVNFQGWVGGIIREFSTGVYKIALELGGLSQSFQPPDHDISVPNFPISYPYPRIPDSSTPVPKRLTPGEKISLVDIVFTSIDHQTVSWAAGTIRFFDGTTQAIAGGSRSMANPVEFMYITLDSSLINFVADLSQTQDWNKVLIGQLNRGTAGIDKVLIIPIRGRISWSLDNIFDGTTFGRLKKSGLTADGFVALDQVREGTTYGKVKKASLDANGLVLLDATVEGNFARIKKNQMDAAGNLIMDYVADGSSYAKVLATSIQAGKIKLWETVERVDAVRVNEQQRAGAARGYDFFENRITAYGVSISSSQSDTRVELTASGIRGLAGGLTQFELRSLDGRAVCGGGSVVLDDEGITIGDGPTFFTFSKLNNPLIFLHRDTPWFFTLRCSGIFLSSSLLVDPGGYLGPASGSGPADLYFYTRDIFNLRQDNRFRPIDLPIGTSGWGYLGDSEKYWFYVFATNLRYKSLASFQDLDDVAVVKRMHSRVCVDKDRSGRDKTVLDPVLCQEVMEDGFYDAGKVSGLLLGAIRQLADRVEDLEKRLK